MAGVQRVALNSLHINIKNALIVGIVIGKRNPRSITSRKRSGELRGTATFTLRDSDKDTINADVWGSLSYVTTFYEKFTVGDVVVVTSPNISVKTGDNEAFRPHVTSPFFLSLNEGVSDLCIYNATTLTNFLPLLHIPTKPTSGYYGLADILKLPEEDNTYVDLLVVVKSVKPVKTLKTKTGSDMTIRSIEIMDNTTPASMKLDIFELETIKRAEEWCPMESVLFIADARVTWRNKPIISVQTCFKTYHASTPHSRGRGVTLLYKESNQQT